jgi:hypothetical protein
MTAMMIDYGKRIAAGGARLQGHMTPIADIDLIARNTPKEEIRSRLNISGAIPGQPPSYSLAWTM